jgi:hypothetical protein
MTTKKRRSTDQLRAGTARREITPAVGVPLSGFIARLGVSTGVAGRLFTRALVLSDSQTTLVLVQMDLLGLAQWHVDEIRRACRRRFGIPPENVLISTTHTHSGPGLVRVRGCPVANAAEQWRTIKKTIHAIEDAYAIRQPASLRTSRVPFRLGVNRRQKTAEGIVLGFDPKRPAPRFLNVAMVTPRSGEACVFFSHAAHPYILGGDNLLISGDFPSFACRSLEESMASNAMFLNGCAGDIAPQRAFEGLAAAQEEGARLAMAVRDAVSRARETRAVPLSARSEYVHLPHAHLPSLADLECMKIERERTVRPEERQNPAITAKIHSAFEDWAGALGRIIKGDDALQPVFSEVQVFRIGDLCLLGISGEPFFATGQNISHGSPADNTWVLGYCNAYTGYLPTALAFREGGYEVSDSYRYLGTWQIDASCERRVAKLARQFLTDRYGK